LQTVFIWLMLALWFHLIRNKFINLALIMKMGVTSIVLKDIFYLKTVGKMLVLKLT